MKTPIEVIMGMAKSEIINYIKLVMKRNSIPYGLMIYILKDIQCEITDYHLVSLNNHFVDLQMELQKSKEKETQNGSSKLPDIAKREDE